MANKHVGEFSVAYCNNGFSREKPMIGPPIIPTS